MKMEGVGDSASNGRASDPAKSSHPSPQEIGREFVRQYYTMLSEKPQDVFRFYSHESFFVYDCEPPVQGQQKIQNAIERLAFINCKVRIYTVTGTATINNSLLIQVCGELSVYNCPARRFFQTFVLCPQTPKKYYVHNDIFQWLDRAYKDTVTSIQEDVEESSGEDNSLFSSGDIPMMNGHSKKLSESNDQTESSVESSAEEQEKNEYDGNLNKDQAKMKSIKVDGSDKKPISEVPTVDDSEHSFEAEKNTITDHEMVSVDHTPKTWANLVGSNNTYPAHILTQMPNVQHGVTTAMRPSPTHNHQISMSATSQPNPNIYSNHENGCHLFVGGITRKLMPESIAQVEKEIRTAFEEFGPVAAVNIPRRAFDANDPQKAVYAFVVMKTPEGAQNAFNAARKDRTLSMLHLKIDSFGFDGEATLSEQKGNQTNSRMPFTHRGLSMQGMARGGFPMRSGVNGVGRGATRGMNIRHYNPGNDFRHMPEYDRH